MATNYPGSLDSITAVTGATSTSATVGGRTHSQLHNDTADAVEAVQAELGVEPSGGFATVVARLNAVDTNIAALDTSTLNVKNYAGYDSADGTIAMSAWMQAFYDCSQQRKQLLVPQKPDAANFRWFLTGGATTSSTSLSDSTGVTTITVANASMFPTTGPFPIILDALAPAESSFTRASSPLNPATNAGAEWATVTSISGTTLTLAPRTSGPLLANGKVHSGTYTVLRALPFLDNLKVKGQYPAGSEGQPVAISVTNSSPGITTPFYWGGGADNTVDGAEVEDIAHWSQAFRCTSPRALFLAGSISVLKDSRFNRCHFKWFTSLRFACSRVQLTNLYINNSYAVTESGNTGATVAGEGILDLSGSDSLMANVYIDTDIYVPATKSLIRCTWSQSKIDYIYVTPAPCRPFEVTGNISGLTMDNIVINGLNNKSQAVGTLAARPSAPNCVGLQYRTNDQSPNVVHRWDGSSWVQVTSNSDTFLTAAQTATLSAVAIGTPSAGQIRWTTTAAHGFAVNQAVRVTSGITGGTNVTNQWFTITAVTSTTFDTSTTAIGGAVASGTVTAASGTITAAYPSASALQTAFPAASNTGRWAQISTASGFDSSALSFYSDGTRWRGPMKTTQDGNFATRQFLGADYGLLFKDIVGSVQIGNLFVRQVAEFDSASTGAIRVDNAAVQIANLTLEQIYGTDIVTLNGGKVSIGNLIKDGATNPTLTVSGTAGTMTRATTTNL